MAIFGVNSLDFRGCMPFGIPKRHSNIFRSSPTRTKKKQRRQHSPRHGFLLHPGFLGLSFDLEVLRGIRLRLQTLDLRGHGGGWSWTMRRPYIYYVYIYTYRAPRTSIFEGQPPKTKAFSQSKQGVNLGSMYINKYKYIYILCILTRPEIWHRLDTQNRHVWKGNTFFHHFPKHHFWIVFGIYVIYVTFLGVQVVSEHGGARKAEKLQPDMLRYSRATSRSTDRISRRRNPLCTIDHNSILYSSVEKLSLKLTI